VSTAPRLALLLATIAPAGCIASNVVAPQQRLIAADPAQLPFAPATPGAVGGFYASVDLRGEAAGSLRKVFYLFAPDGTYTGAALAESDGRASFQTLDGTWSLDAAGLVLDGAAPVACEVAGEHLRLTAPTGVLVLRREVLP
jgi:hypothetical protein